MPKKNIYSPCELWCYDDNKKKFKYFVHTTFPLLWYTFFDNFLREINKYKILTTSVGVSELWVSERKYTNVFSSLLTMLNEK